jgi:hypothetical protein
MELEDEQRDRNPPDAEVDGRGGAPDQIGDVDEQGEDRDGADRPAPCRGLGPRQGAAGQRRAQQSNRVADAEQ